MLSDLRKQREHILYVDDTNLDPQGFPKDAIQQSTRAWTGARTRLGGAGARCWDNNVAVAARLALGFKGIYRNLVIHYPGQDGLIIPEHHDIINRVKAHSLKDPDRLLPRHHFLMDADFKALGKGPTSD